MASYTTLIDGTKWFTYYGRKQNRVRPAHSQATMYICKYGGHICIDPIHKDFGKGELPPDLLPYMLAEHSLRLLQMARQELSKTNEKDKEKNDLYFEALMFNSHKVYPPGDKYSPELSHKGQNKFDQLHIKKNRTLTKLNSIIVRKTFGIISYGGKKQWDPSPRLVRLNKQLLANELHYLQDKDNDELEKMGIPRHGKVYDLETGKVAEKIFPSDSIKLSKLWWKEFNNLKGFERYERNSGFDDDYDDDYDDEYEEDDSE